MSPRNRVSLLLSGLLVAIGVTLTVVTFMSTDPGFKLGFVLGPALFLAGLGRGWLALQMERRD